ncbi:MAG: tautomerase family protein [Promethearchaeota archaeon]
MPLVRIEIRKGKRRDYKKALLDGLHDALVFSLKIPEQDRTQRLYELEPENFEIMNSKTENYTIIEITMFQGRSLDAKKLLYKEIINNLSKSPGISGNDIMIVIHEPPLENWGIRGGKPASEVDLGFNLKV